MLVNDREFESVIALPAPERYGHFIKRVADNQELWALRDAEGWLLLGDDEENEAFPVWPAERYAVAYGEAQGMAEKPEAIELSTWMEEMLPDLAANGVLIAVFPIPTGAAVTVTADDHAAHLELELEEYE